VLFSLCLISTGLVILYFGADLLIKGASSLARRLGLSLLVISLTVIAFGTSLPEFVVSLFSDLRSIPDLAIGNIIGSNIVNILLILGLSASIGNIKLNNKAVKAEIPFALFVMLLLFLLANDAFVAGEIDGMFSRKDGMILLAALFLFIYYTFILFQTGRGRKPTEVAVYPWWLSGGMMIFGIFCLYYGGTLLIDNSLLLARVLGLSNAFTGLMIVSLGTSLPELAVAMVAASQKKTDVVVGSVVGSNIGNVLWIVGITSLIKPFEYNLQMNIDIIVAIGATALLLVFAFAGNKKVITRNEGWVMIGLYLIYLIYLVWRG